MKQRQEEGSWVGRVRRFLHRGQWEVPESDLPWLSRSALKILRFVSLVTHGFMRNNCSLHAASLTFYSMMALVPVLVLALALARTFGGADLVRGQVDAQVNTWMLDFERSAAVPPSAGSDQQNVDTTQQAHVVNAFSTQLREIVDKLYAQVEAINFGTLGGIGLLMLLWTVISVLGKVEESFNGIWGVEKPRALVRKFTDYLSVILILPFLITAVSSIPVANMIMDMMNKTMGGATAASMHGLIQSPFLKTGITLTLGSLTFAFLLGFMPNEQVRIGPALVGGIVTTVLFGVWLKLCAMLQIGIAKYSALYGGFAVLPILLMWLYTSWQIILLGAEIAFAAQNRETYRLEQYATQASVRSRLTLALALCAQAARQVREPSGGAFDAMAFARSNGISHRFVKEVLDDLIRMKLFAEVADPHGTYLLARCGSTLRVSEIVQMFLDDGESSAALGLQHLDAWVYATREDTLDHLLEKEKEEVSTHEKI